MSGDARNVIILLSGGIDSAVTAFLASEMGYALHALTLDYGQRHVVEVEAAKRVASAVGVTQHIIQSIDLRVFGGSALTSDVEVPKHHPGIRQESDIPVTYVPARNTIFLACSLAYAEVVRACDVFLGINAVDYSGYPDCRGEFLAAFERVANLATKAGVEGTKFTLHAPLLRMSKAEIIREGARLGVDFASTHSCYDPIMPGAMACGECDSCLFRRQGFREAGLTDPTRYAASF